MRGPFSTPITPLTGSIFHADPHLGQLAQALGDKDYLEGQFTVGDLMMADVLRIIDSTGIIDEFPTLKAYKARCETRPAFQRAMASQMEGFAKAA